jgi:hypothetical protein
MYNECRHIFTSGRKCQSPALKEQPFCYFHSNTRKRPSPANQPYYPYTDPKETVLPLPPLEEPDAIQLALSDVILALAANRIDRRRARILIYGLQVASQNIRNRAAQAAKEEAPTQTVRETHQHEDGTQIGPEQQSPDPEEIEEQRRRPSLGEILLREAEALYGHKREPEEGNITLPQIHAVADLSIKRCHPERSRRNPHEQSSCEALRRQGPPFTVLPNHKQWTNLQKHQGGTPKTNAPFKRMERFYKEGKP